MALLSLSSSFFCSTARLHPKQHAPQVCRATKLCMAKQTQHLVETPVTRRSGNYPPSCWDYDFVISLRSDYSGEMHGKQAEKLKESVRYLLVNHWKDQVAQLEFIDAIQRLGLGYHFEEEIRRALDIIKNDDLLLQDKNLYVTALRFRLLRQHGIDAPQDVFNSFKDGMGSFKKSVCEDIKGMLSLYEASHFGIEDEKTMDEAKAFTYNHLKAIDGKILIPSLAKAVAHALEVPLHWRLPRLEARWYIDAYEKEENMNPSLLELAKLDYNMVQATYQTEVSRLARWWVDLGLHKLSFVRDRLVEHFFWSQGMLFEPQFGPFRERLTKVTCLITVIDDIYDVYGSFEELELFTNAIDRWDIDSMKQLPQYMKMCLLALYNTNNEIGYEILKEQGIDITSYQKKAWVDLCKSYFVEAKWYYQGYKPTLDEYLKNAVISIAAPLMLTNAYFLTTKDITIDALECLGNNPRLIYLSSVILRLADDLGTSTDELDRGDVPKSIQCYMHEKGVSEDVAREHIHYLISETWKTMNEERVVNHHLFPQHFINAAANLGRTAQCMYQYGDGHGVSHHKTKDRLMSLLVEPIPFK